MAGGERVLAKPDRSHNDATGKVPHALFREQEDAQGYFLSLRRVVGSYGIPIALYHDRHGIFERSKSEPESLEEQLEGRRKSTQFGRLMGELGITSIPSGSPQARGRIERLWGTFQGRLVMNGSLAVYYQGALPSYHTGTPGGSGAQGEEYSTGYTQYD